MDIGKEGEPYVTEPVEDPFRKESPVETPERERELVPVGPDDLDAWFAL